MMQLLIKTSLNHGKRSKL